MTLQRKAFSDIITFSRASNATVTGSDGLIQYAPHNLLTYSQEFDNAAWTKARATVTANAFAAPDGTVTADKLTEDTTASNTHLVQETLTLATGLSLTVSVYAKAAERNWIRLQVNANASADGSAYFDLSTGAIGAIGGGTAEITPVGNGWYRCTVSGTTTTINPIVRVNLANANNGQTYTGDGVSGVYIWGAQLATGNRALSYTPTTSAAVYGPRFDYDPVSMAPKGLLVEEQRTNLVLNSDDFSTINWNKVRATVLSNVVAAPDGTVTADKLVSDTTAATTHYTQQAVTTTAASHTCTVYAKAGENNGIYVLNSTVSAGVYFDLATGAISSIVGSATGSITPAGNGWYRCSVTMTATAASNTFRLSIAQDGSGVIDGDGVSGIYIWGAQLEAGAFATSYIPTVASQVTRSADVASVNTMSPWYNATEGTFYVHFKTNWGSLTTASATSAVLYGLDATQRINYFGSGGSAVSSFDGTNITPLTGNAVGIDAKVATALTASTNSIAGSLNGSSVNTGTFTKTAAITQVQIGGNLGGSYLNGHFKRIAYYPRRLTNSELQALTA